MNTLKTIIIDDTPLAVEKLEGFVRQVPVLKHECSFNRALDAIRYMQENEVDLIFLDIQMDEFSGLQFMDALQNPPHIVIVSAYSQYAVDGFEHNVVDYLFKPYSFERFLKDIDKVIARQKDSKTKDYMFVKSEYRMVRIDFRDILYVVSKGAYLQFVLKNDVRIMTLMNFSTLLSHLPSSDFVRVHRSYVVSTDKIEGVSGNVLEIGKARILVGRSYRENFSKNVL